MGGGGDEIDFVRPWVYWCFMYIELLLIISSVCVNTVIKSKSIHTRRVECQRKIPTKKKRIFFP